MAHVWEEKVITSKERKKVSFNFVSSFLKLFVTILQCRGVQLVSFSIKTDMKNERTDVYGVNVIKTL